MYPQIFIKIFCIIFLSVSSLNAFGADRGAILSGEVKTGSLEVPAYQDTWTFYGDVGDRVIITTARISGGVEPEIYLYPPGSGPLEDSVTGLSSYNRLDTQLQDTGIYTIIVSDWLLDENGEYGIALMKIPGAVTSATDTDGGDIASGENYTGNLSGHAETDGFQFYGDVGDRVIITTARISGGVEPEIYLYPPGSGPLEDSVTGLSSYNRLDTQLQNTGIYTIIVSDWLLDENGEYGISLSKIPSTLSTGIYNSYPNNTCQAIYSNSHDYFYWDSVNGATSYDLYFGENVTTPLQHIGVSLPSPKMDSPEFSCNTIYFWHVVAHTGSSDIEGPYYPFGATNLPAKVITVPLVQINGDKLGFKWNATCGAAHYRLSVSDFSGVKIDKLLTPAEADCSDGTGICTIIPDKIFSTGDYTWEVQATNCVGNGAWSVTESFSLYDVTAKAAGKGNGSGTISSNVGEINYMYPPTNTSTTSILTENSSITLTATANTGSTVSWMGCSSTGGTSTTATCTFSSIDGNKTVEATFSQYYTVSTLTQAGQGGFVTLSQIINHGETAEFTIRAEPGYSIDTVTGCGGTWAGTNPYVTDPITSDCVVTAIFIKKFPWILFNHLRLVGENVVDDRLCSKIAGDWRGSWNETSCNGHGYSGSWTGRVTEDCSFNGTDNWDYVSGTINPSSMVLTGRGISQEGCGTITMTGLFSNNGSASGNYTYAISGGGTFTGARTNF